MADSVDPLPGLDVLDSDRGSSDAVDLSDRSSVVIRHRSTGAPEEDRSKCFDLLVITSLVDVEKDVPLAISYSA